MFPEKTIEAVVEKPPVEEEKDETATPKTKSQGRCIDTSKLERERVVRGIASETPCCQQYQGHLVKFGVRDYRTARISARTNKSD